MYLNFDYVFGVCPVCGSENYSDKEFNYDEDTAWLIFECDDCDSEWESDFKFIGNYGNIKTKGDENYEKLTPKNIEAYRKTQKENE